MNIALITIVTHDVPPMVAFYRDVLDFPVKLDMGEYVEFESEGVRFSICSSSVLESATGTGAYLNPPAGQRFELAFPCASPQDVDLRYAECLSRGAKGVKEPADMPWNQRTAFFADPDGNIHELFADFPPS